MSEKKVQSIKWQSPGSDVVHEIPKHAEVTFRLGDECFSIQMKDGEFLLAEGSINEFIIAIGTTEDGEK